MYRLSLIIGEIYNKFLPLAEKGKISLNLDFSDTTQEVSSPEEIRQALEQALDSAFQRTDRGDISITVSNSEIIITDQGTILSKTVCALLSHGRVKVKSRVGFGTNVSIALGPAAPADDRKTSSQNTTSPEFKAKAVVETGGAKDTSKNTTEPKPKPKKIASSSKRAIDTAAKRADKKVQKIAEKAQKRREKTSAKKKPKVIHKIDFS